MSTKLDSGGSGGGEREGGQAHLCVGWGFVGLDLRYFRRNLNGHVLELERKNKET